MTITHDFLTVWTGDFFKDELPKADLYILARILHDWPDEKVHILLSKIADACTPGKFHNAISFNLFVLHILQINVLNLKYSETATDDFTDLDVLLWVRYCSWLKSDELLVQTCRLLDLL